MWKLVCGVCVVWLEMKQQVDDVASWWSWNVFELLVSYYGDVMEVISKANSLPVCLMSKASSTQSWLWHRRLSYLNFDTINDLTKHDLVDGVMKFKYGKDHLCSACEKGKSKKASHLPKLVPSSHSKLELLYMDLCGPMRVTSINGKKHNKTPDKLLHGKKLNVEYFYVFGTFYYPINNQDDPGKLKPKADIGIFIGYSKTSKGFQIYNRHTKKIMETIHVRFNELTTMAFEDDSLKPVSQQFINDDSSAESMNTPSKEDLDNLFGPMYDEYFKKNTFNMSINFAGQQVHNQEDSSLTSLIDIEAHKAPPNVTTSEEPTSPISLTMADEVYQENSAELDGNMSISVSNQDQSDDFDFWTYSYDTHDDVLSNEKVSQDLMDEMSQTIDDDKLRKVVDEMLRQQCTSGDEHQYHIDQMQNFLKNGVESYQQQVNLTAPTINFPGIEKYKVFSIVSKLVYGIIYKNSKKEKRVMRHQKVHKFCDATLKSVLEGLKSYKNDVKYGYVNHNLSKEDVEYL
nr:integrase, catalytic region, zinc finger, CCHC-type, peptidase aspartic, catalytic [Tanacetum cinerariifolium]